MSNKIAQTIIVHVVTRSSLTEPYYRRLWMASRNLSIPRRGWLDELAGTIYDFRGKVFYPSGEPFVIPCIDELFGDDPDARWMSLYLEAGQSGDFPRRISRKFERIQIIDLYFRVKYPYIAQHFAR